MYHSVASIDNPLFYIKKKQIPNTFVNDYHGPSE